MRKAELRKQLLLERMADHVLAHGLQAASLRPLAAAGTLAVGNTGYTNI